MGQYVYSSGRERNKNSRLDDDDDDDGDDDDDDDEDAGGGGGGGGDFTLMKNRPLIFGENHVHKMESVGNWSKIYVASSCNLCDYYYYSTTNSYFNTAIVVYDHFIWSILALWPPSTLIFIDVCPSFNIQAILNMPESVWPVSIARGSWLGTGSKRETRPNDDISKHDHMISSHYFDMI